ncbi:MAG: hypothetical protein K0S14_3164, partial [Thermomicrobiales bacterium]|nr:hypothetical protein [Thermomicrobiales bacterium]
MKVQRAFDQCSRPKQCCLLSGDPSELNTHRQAITIETARNCQYWLSSRVERHGQPGPGRTDRFVETGALNH